MTKQEKTPARKGNPASPKKKELKKKATPAKKAVKKATASKKPAKKAAKKNLSQKSPAKKAAVKRATTKKSGPKKAVAKKTAPRKAAANNLAGKGLKAMSFAVAQEAVSPNFSYSFTPTKCTVLSFVVEGQEIPVPPNSGTFFILITDPNPTKKVRARVLVRQDFPGALVSLDLKYNDKAVTTPALVFSGGKATFNKLITLP